MGTCAPRLPYVPVLGALDLRRGGDSNPRYPCGVQRLSRAPDSATLAPLQFKPPLGAGESSPRSPLNFARASGTMGRGKRERRGRDSNPRNREAAQRFSRPPPSTTRTPLPSTKNAHAAESPWQRAAAHFVSLSSPDHYTHRPALCQQNRPFASSSGAVRGITIRFATAGASPAISSPASPR